MKKCFAIDLKLLGYPLLFLPGWVNAEVFGDYYVGLGYTLSTHGGGPIAVESDTNAVLSGRETGNAVYAGMRFFKYLGVEIGYKQFGVHRGVLVTKQYETVVPDYWMSLSTIDLTVGFYPTFMDNKLTLFGRGGFGDVTVKDKETEYIITLEDAGAFIFTLGGEFQIRNGFFLRADLTYYLVGMTVTYDTSKTPELPYDRRYINIGPETGYRSFCLSLGYVF